MKIAITRGLAGNFLGGAETETIDLTEILTIDNNEVVVITNSLKLKDRLNCDVIVLDNWPKRSDGFFRYLQTINRLSKDFQEILTKKFRPDIIITQSREDLIASVNSAKHENIPILLRDHADLKHLLKKHRKNPFSILFQKLYINKLKSVKKIMTVNKYEKNHIASFLPGNDIVVMRSGLNLNNYHPQKKSISSSPKKTNVSVVSRLVQDKGIKHFIEAIAKLDQKTLARIMVNIIGDGDYREALEAYSVELGTPINFCGYKSNPDDIYNNIDILVQPSEYEGWSRTVSEGMHYGCSILASDIPSHKEQLGDGSGLLFESKNTKDLAVKLERLINNSGLRKTLSNCAQTRVAETSDINILVEKKLLPLLNEALP